MGAKAEADSGSLRTVAPVLVWVLASGGLIFFGMQAVSSIRHWAYGSGWHLIVGLCVVIGAVPFAALGSLKSVRSGLAWVLASGGVALIGGLVEGSIRRWVSRGFYGTYGDFILALCIFVGALATVVVGFIRICQAPVRWYWRILAAILGLLVISFWLYGLAGIML
jgi:hypothetical protein